MAGLEVTIGGDIIDWEKKVKEVELDIKALSNEKAIQIKLGLDTKEITANIKDAKKHLADLKTTIKDTGTSFGGMAPKVANGSNAMTQFNRIIQDAPFGPMGVQNNITAFGESFGYLVAQTGSAKEAMKLMTASLIGSGGIMLAISLVTSGLTYMSQNGLTVGDVFRKLSGDFDENARALRDLGAEVAKNSSAGITEMNSYVSAAKNVNLSMSDRLLAVKHLQDEYPAYFGNLSKEQILNGNVAGAVKEVTAALIAKAKAAALSSKLADLAEKEFLLREQEVKATKKLADAQKSLNQTSTGGGTFGATGQFGEGRLAAAKSNLEDIQAEIKSIIATQNLYTKEIEKSVAASIKLETSVSKSKKAKETGFTPQVIGVKSEIDSIGLAETAGKIMQVAKGVQGAEGVITTSMGNIKIAVDTGFLDMMETMNNFNKSATDIIKGAITETFTSLGTMIGNSMVGAEGGLKDAGKVILGILGSFMSDYGKLMISTGVGLIIGEQMLKSGNGYAMIAGGVALVAVGTAFASKAKSSRESASSSMSGGSTGGYYSSPASSSGSSGGSSSFGGGTVVFEISGQSLIGVLSNTLDQNSKLGGTLGI